PDLAVCGVYPAGVLAGGGADNRAKEGLLFVNKKKQKNFSFPGALAAGTPRIEVFWSFFFKKRTASLLPASSAIFPYAPAGFGAMFRLQVDAGGG
ncbi:MAG TPA: hypothetical protein VL154_06405, partial [Acetobacteraceae bacterium]|nr:hypothetical protein [Acetobacteraceae bacterium]